MLSVFRFFRLERALEEMTAASKQSAEEKKTDVMGALSLPVHDDLLSCVAAVCLGCLLDLLPCLLITAVLACLVDRSACGQPAAARAVERCVLPASDSRTRAFCAMIS